LTCWYLDAERVCKRSPLEFKGRQIYLEFYWPINQQFSEKSSDFEEQGDTATIVVTGFSQKTTQNTLEMYFESTRRSGGGDILNVPKFDKENKIARITFQDSKGISVMLYFLNVFV